MNSECVTNRSPLDYEIVEHTPNKHGNGLAFFKVVFRPSPAGVRLLGKGDDVTFSPNAEGILQAVSA